MPTPPATSPFATYARENGFAKLSKLPGALPKMLSFNPKNVAPNSPMLEELAKHMGVPIAELQAFAKGPPMQEKWVKKFRTQIERGTVPRGKRSVNKRFQKPAAKHVRATGKVRGHYKSGPAKHPLAKLIQEKGLTTTILSKKLGLKQSTVWRASMGLTPPNHPVISIIADALGEPAGKLAAMQNAKPLIGGWLAKAEEQYAAAQNGHKSHDRTPGKAVVLASVEHSPGTNGKHHEVRGYNRLGSKRADLQLRQSARAMIATLNIAIMRGESHMPPLPVGDLFLVLQDYVQEKGIKASVLVDPAFAELFDPR